MNRDEIQANLIKASHMISMDDIIREGYPTLREVANDVTLPLSDEDIILGEKTWLAQKSHCRFDSK